MTRTPNLGRERAAADPSRRGCMRRKTPSARRDGGATSAPRPILRAILRAGLGVPLLCGLGCVAPGRDADLTPIYQPLPSGGSEASFPAKLIDPGADGNITIKVSENKDFLAQTWYENGNQRAVITGDRSGVIGATTAGVGSIEAARIDARLEQLDRTLAFLNTQIERGMSLWATQQAQAAPAQPGGARLRKALTALLAIPNLPPEARAVIEALAAE